MAEQLNALVFCPSPMGIFEQSLALQEHNWLGTMAIDYYCDLDSHRYGWIPEGRLKKYLRKRYHPALDSRNVRIRPLPSALTRFGINLSRSNESLCRWVFWHNLQFDRWVAGRLPSFGNL